MRVRLAHYSKANTKKDRGIRSCGLSLYKIAKKSFENLWLYTIVPLLNLCYNYFRKQKIDFLRR